MIEERAKEQIRERIRELRTLMKKEGIDTYIITKLDPHQTEYAPKHWGGVKFISGFSGSQGTVVVTSGEAGLWTDGRYYIQAMRELKDTGIDLHRMAEPGVRDFMTYAASETPKGGVIGFDGRTLSMTEGLRLKEKAACRKISLMTGKDLVGELWSDRPPMPDAPVFNHKIEFCGKTRVEKLQEVREEMKKIGAEVYVISSADDIAWLYNLRVCEKPDVTFFASYTVIDYEKAAVFISRERWGEANRQLTDDGILLKDYGDVFDYLKKYSKEQVFLVNPAKTGFSMYEALEGGTIAKCEHDITAKLKAVKNSVELANLEKVNIRDGVVMVRFIKWLKEAVKNGGLTEYDIENKLTELRSFCENYLCPSFRTISAYMANGAMMHYSAEPEKCSEIKPEGILLVDSGGSYLDGTTDITRTIAVGEISQAISRDFTLVLKSHIALARLIFLYGATGSNIDIVARLPMWSNGLDYKSGTGHGIGFCLNVHEGPHRISPIQNGTALEAGMIVTNEPGIYREDQYGIRTENTLLVKEAKETEFGRFMKFETISYCPIDLSALDASLLDEDEREWLNKYHEAVYKKLSPELTELEREWLKNATRGI